MNSNDLKVGWIKDTVRILGLLVCFVGLCWMGGYAVSKGWHDAVELSDLERDLLALTRVEVMLQRAVELKHEE